MVLKQQTKKINLLGQGSQTGVHFDFSRGIYIMCERMFAPSSSDARAKSSLDVAYFTDILASLQCFTEVGIH